MTIKQFIEKAIEGGWNPSQEKMKVRSISDFGIYFQIPKKPEMGELLVRTEAVLLDPLAWQAVGEVKGWKRDEFEGEIKSFYGTENVQETIRIKWSPWEYKMHRMIDALAEGKTIEKFLETL